jgi:integrase
LTASQIGALTCPPGKRDVTYFDDGLPGFGLRCRSTGVRRWVVQYEQHGHTRRITIGPPEVLGLDQARKIARTHLAKKVLGEDPAQEKAIARQAAKHTLRAVIEGYIEASQPGMRPLTIRQVQRYLRDWWQPLAATPIYKLTRKDIAPYLRGPAGAAAAARTWLRACCTWAIEQGYIETNPVVGTSRPDRNVEPRSRVLSLPEIATIWHACADDSAYSSIVRLLVTTACRRQEVGSMAWSELDREQGTWTIPASRSKSGKAQTLPLPPLAWQIVDTWSERGLWPECLFSEKGFSSWTEGKRALDVRCGVANWTLHDIRRSVATHMGDLGISPHAIERVLGHSLGGSVMKTYNRSVYLNDMRVALATWADFLQSVIDGGSGRKIIPMRS